MKNIRKLVFVLVILSCMMLTVNAEILAPGLNPPTRIAILGNVNQTLKVRTYGQDGDTRNYVAWNLPCPAYAIWMSNIYGDTIYKMTLHIDEYMKEVGETGFMAKTDDFAVYLIPSEDMLSEIDVSPAVYDTDQSYRHPWTDFEPYRLQDNQYELFWDKTLEQLSCLFYNETLTTNCYIMMRLGTLVDTPEDREYYGLPVSAEIIKGPQGIYTGILEDIKRLLEDSFEGGGAGLTEEQLNQAIQDALTAHDQHLQSDVQQQGTQAEQIVDELGDLVPAVKLQTALQGLSAAVSGNHRSCVLVLPEIVEPVTGGKIMEQTSIDLTGTIQGIINGDSRIGTLVDLIRWINLLVLAFSLIRSIMNIINYVTSGGDQGG